MAEEQLSVDDAEFIATIFETGLYGIYLVFFPITLHILFNQSRWRGGGFGKVNKPLVISSILIFIFTTTHWALDIMRLSTAFLKHKGEATGPLLFYATISDTRNVLRTAVFICQVVTLDSMLIYRLYVIWNKTIWILIPPALTLLGITITGIETCISFARTKLGSHVFDIQLKSWITSDFVLSLCTNILAISFITFRIVKRDREMKHVVTAGSLRSIVIIIIESASLYCIFNIMTLVSLLAGSNLQFIWLSALSPVSGISFSLIVLRVGLPQLFATTTSTDRLPSSRGGVSARSVPEVIPMQVKVTHDQTYAVLSESTPGGGYGDSDVYKSSAGRQEWV